MHVKNGGNNDESQNCFKIIIFSIDSYVTKPNKTFDETYSKFRKQNVNLATVVRIFGSTENGIKTCVHIHQHCPHFSLLQKDVAQAYGINLSENNDDEIADEILSSFVEDVENQLTRFIARPNKKNENEVFLVNIEKFSSYPFYGYHNGQEAFLKVYFNSYWMANQAKQLLESGLIKSYRFVCYNFLEFNLQFYVDHQIYLNEIYFKKITFRKSNHSNVDVKSPNSFDFVKKHKLESVKNILRYNEMIPSSNCIIECDALIHDILIIKHKRLFPENSIFNPTIPGIISMLNSQYERSPYEFDDLLKSLKTANGTQSEIGCKFDKMKRETFFVESSVNNKIPQLDGTCHEDAPSIFCIFRRKRIEIKANQFKSGRIHLQKINFSIETNYTNLPITILNSQLMNVDQNGISKRKLIYHIYQKIDLFKRPNSYLKCLKPNVPSFHITNTINMKLPLDLDENHHPIKLYFSDVSPDKKVDKNCTAKQQNKSFRKILLDKIKNNLNISVRTPNSFKKSSSIIKNETFDNMKNIFHWSQHLNMTLMSLELHARSKGNMTADPKFDPIQIAVFAIYEEILKDSYSSTSGNHKISPSKSNLMYLGAIVVQPKSRFLNCENLRFRNKYLIIDYVKSELDLFMKLEFYMKTFDPDIVLGYIIDTLSFGYLLQRASILGLDIGPLFSRIHNTFQSKKNHPGAPNECPHLIGRIALNVWRILRHELTLRSYSFENVYFHMFQNRFPKYSKEFINELWNKFLINNNETCKHLILEYYLNRTLGSLKILTHLSFVSRTFGLSRLYGMQFQDVIDRGTQFRVESMLFPLCKKENFIPIRVAKDIISKQRSAQSTPLIFEPDITFHHEPVAVLDFQSLYPSIIIAHNYCYSTCLGRMRNAFGFDNSFGCFQLSTKRFILEKPEDLNKHLHVSPNEILFVNSDIRKGILPRMLEEILNTRILIKNELKNVDKKLRSMQRWMVVESVQRSKLKVLKHQLDICQLGLKNIANVTYGYTNANFSGRMPCIEIADSIVAKGRETLENAITFVNDWGRKSGTKAQVIYGDTDSLFISFPQTSLDVAFQMTAFLLEEINKRQTYPIYLKLEKIYKPCILMAKKRYCGYAYESSKQSTALFEAKGIETVRRDSCNLSSKIVEKSIKILFTQNMNLNSLKSYLQWEFKKILLGRINQLTDFIFAREFAGFRFYHNETIIPSCIVARRRLQVDPKNETRFKDRVPYVIVQGNPHTQSRLADLVHEPLDLLLLDLPLRLNANYYIKNIVIPPLVRILDSLMEDSLPCLESWYQEVLLNFKQKIGLYSNIETYFQIMKCPFPLIDNGNFQLNDPHYDEWNSPKRKEIANKNIKKEDHLIKPATLIWDAHWIYSKKLKQFEKICDGCANIGIIKTLVVGSGENNNDRHPCQNENCSILYRYHQTKKDILCVSFMNKIIATKFYSN